MKSDSQSLPGAPTAPQSRPLSIPAPIADLHAPPSWRRIACISDLHLGPEAPATVAGFLRWLQTDALSADALFILGDLFEAWVGDDLLESAPHDALEKTPGHPRVFSLPSGTQTQSGRFGGALEEAPDLSGLSHPPLGADQRADAGGTHHQVCAALAAYAAGGRAVRVMHGNRDFLLGTGFARACGALILPDPCVLNFAGQRILLTHGDALCIADTPYLQWRAVCRQADWQAHFLAQPLTARLEQAAAARAQSRAAQSRMDTWSDADPQEAARWLRAADSHWMIHGHTHRPRDHWEHGRLRQVLSDWDLDAEADQGAARCAQCLWLHSSHAALRVERLATV